VLDKKAAACTMCHASGEPLLHASTMNRSRIFTLAGGKEVLGLAKAIYNETTCYVADCHFHPESAKVLGVLDVIVSLENMQAQLSSSRSWVIGLTMVLLLLISLFLALFTQQLVNKPVKQLLDHTNLLAQGDLTQTIPFCSDDELYDNLPQEGTPGAAGMEPDPGNEGRGAHPGDPVDAGPARSLGEARIRGGTRGRDCP
jgi:two-component system NtrC family sensor kinase